jgi:hypothetical protein
MLHWVPCGVVGSDRRGCMRLYDLGRDGYATVLWRHDRCHFPFDYSAQAWLAGCSQDTFLLLSDALHCFDPATLGDGRERQTRYRSDNNN